MARGKHHRIPGFIWHITHRCHNRDFKLEDIEDKRAWLYWLSRAKEKYDLTVLNYAVTSNHIHLLAIEEGEASSLSRAIQLAASRTAMSHNARHESSGAFWNDNYHATAVSTDIHLVNCLTYIDLNMVRAGVVEHPCEWPYGGYLETEQEFSRYQIVDRVRLKEMLGLADDSALRRFRRQCVEHFLAMGRKERESAWTESAAVGDREFIRRFASRLGSRANSMSMEPWDQGFVLNPGRNLRTTPFKECAGTRDA